MPSVPMNIQSFNNPYAKIQKPTHAFVASVLISSKTTRGKKGFKKIRHSSLLLNEVSLYKEETLLEPTDAEKISLVSNKCTSIIDGEKNNTEYNFQDNKEGERNEEDQHTKNMKMAIKKMKMMMIKPRIYNRRDSYYI